MSELCKAVGKKVMIEVTKKAPELFLGVGISSLIGSNVLACKGTLKLEEVNTDYQAMKEEIEYYVKLRESTKSLSPGDVFEGKELTEEKLNEIQLYTKKVEAKYKLQNRIYYAKDLAKLYGPSVALGAFGICCLIKGQKILQNRNLALMSAYNLLKGGFDAYRQRVRDELGNVMDDHFRYGTKLQEHIETESDPESGKKVKTKSLQNVYEPLIPGASIYARMFDYHVPSWSNNDDRNIVTIQSKQNWFNMALQRDGIVFLNEVYQEFGFPKTQAGAIVGWNNRTTTGDGVIQFRIEKVDLPEYSSKEKSAFLIDFNVDGPVYNELALEV